MTIHLNGIQKNMTTSHDLMNHLLISGILICSSLVRKLNLNSRVSINIKLILLNSHSESPGSCWSNNCFIRSDSKVSCFLICNNRAQCFSDYENWPQDVQKCYLNFGSLSLHGNKINFEVGKVKINTKRVLDSHQWKLLSATTIIDEGNNNETYTFPTVTYKLLISQHTTLPIAVIFVPLLGKSSFQIIFVSFYFYLYFSTSNYKFVFTMDNSWV